MCSAPPGVALKHTYEKVFTSDSGMRRNVPKVLVVVTDGRSQDDVKKSAEKLQHSGTQLPSVSSQTDPLHSITSFIPPCSGETALSRHTLAHVWDVSQMQHKAAN